MSKRRKTRRSPSTVDTPGPVDSASHANGSEGFYADVRTADGLGPSNRRTVRRGVRHPFVLRKGIAPDDSSPVRKAQVRYVDVVNLALSAVCREGRLRDL